MPDKKYLFGLSSIAWLIILGAAAKFTIHLLTASHYGFFCDELYTIALSKHLALGYVDLPPLVPALVAINRALLGESLLALHIAPALAGAGTLVFVCLITKELGGKLFAIGLSALAFIMAPVWLILDSFFCYDSIDQLLLALFLYVLALFLKSGNKKLWLALGATAGVACLTKTTILYFSPGFLIALLISKYRKDLLTRWPWLGGGLLLLIVTPYLLWEIANEWPTLEYWRSYSSHTLYHSSIPEYFVSLVLTMNPLLFPVLVIGLYRIFKRFDTIDYSLFGILFLVTLVWLFSLHARTFMLAALFMPLIAAGSIFIEGQLARRRWERWGKVAAASYLVAGFPLVAPSALPLLPVDALPAYARTFGFLYQPVKDFTFAKSDYPQEFSNRIGWEEMVQAVADVYHDLPPEEREIAGILGDWYGPAGAVDLYGPRYGLPHAVSGHLNYHLWGPGYSWEVMILVTGNIEAFRPFFADIQQAAVIENKYAMPWDKPSVYVARKPRLSAELIWPYLKFY